MTDFAHLFRFARAKHEVAEDDRLLNERNELLDFAATAHFPKFIAWLESEANRHLDVTEHTLMIQSAVRANTLREIRNHLVKRVELARAAQTEGD